MEELYIKYNFPSEAYFYEILKKNNINKSHSQVKEFIAKQNIHQVFKPNQNIKKKFKYILSSAPNEMYQIDLLDYKKFGTRNKGFCYVLIMVDIYSRFAYCEAIKNKSPVDILAAFKSLTEKNLPHSIFHDDGKEWMGIFKKYIDDEDIVDLKTETGDHHSLGIIDRFSRTIKTMIYKYMTANNRADYTTVLPILTDLYNTKPHSSLDGISPSDASKTNENKTIIDTINFHKQIHNKKVSAIKNENQIKAGDTVRIEHKKGIFTKGYTVNFSTETYKVVSVVGNYATLNDGQKKRLDKIIKVSPDAVSIESNILENVDKQARLKKKWKMAGIYD